MESIYVPPLFNLTTFRAKKIDTIMMGTQCHLIELVEITIFISSCLNPIRIFISHYHGYIERTLGVRTIGNIVPVASSLITRNRTRGRDFRRASKSFIVNLDRAYHSSVDVSASGLPISVSLYGHYMLQVYALIANKIEPKHTFFSHLSYIRIML